MRVQINEEKTEYMEVTASQVRRWLQYLEPGRYKFKSVRNFSYLGIDLNHENKVAQEINKRILAGNRV